MRRDQKKWSRVIWLCMALLLLSLTACGLAGADRAGESDEPTRIGLGLSGLNYTDMPIGPYYVNGSWGGAVNAYNGCCKFAGGVSLPYPWRPGTTVEVKWSDDELYAKDPDALYTAQVEVPKYERIYVGHLWVAFFPGRQVRVYASGVGPGHKDFPDGLKVPRTYCREQPGCLEWLKSRNPPREGHY